MAAFAKRPPFSEKEIRDILFIGVWRTGQLKNEQIGHLFGLSYSVVSHAAKSAIITLPKHRKLQAKFN
jgi:hypothetical protein